MNLDPLVIEIPDVEIPGVVYAPKRKLIFTRLTVDRNGHRSIDFDIAFFRNDNGNYAEPMVEFIRSQSHGEEKMKKLVAEYNNRPFRISPNRAVSKEGKFLKTNEIAEIVGAGEQPIDVMDYISGLGAKELGINTKKFSFQLLEQEVVREIVKLYVENGEL